jgi:chromosome segregation ATPase
LTKQHSEEKEALARAMNEEKEAMIKQHQEAIADLEAKLLAAKDQIDTKTAELSASLEDFEAKRVFACRELEDATEAAREAKERCHALEQGEQAVQAELAGAKEALVASGAAVAEAKEQASQAKQELESVQQELQAQRNAVEDLKSKIEQLQVEQARLVEQRDADTASWTQEREVNHPEYDQRCS